MFSNDTNLWMQLLPLIFSWLLSIVFSIIINKMKKTTSKIVSKAIGISLLSCLFALVVFSMISYKLASKSILENGYLSYSISFFRENATALKFFLISIMFTFIISLITEILIDKPKMQRILSKNISFVCVLACMLSACAFCALLYVNYPFNVTSSIPASLLTKSFNTIPIEFILEEDVSYFLNNEYLRPKPLVNDTSPSISLPSSTETPNNDNTQAATSPEPEESTVKEVNEEREYVTFSDYMSDASDNVEHLKKAYELFLADQYSKPNDKYIIASMWFQLGYQNVYPEERDQFFKNAIKEYSSLTEWFNVGAVYYNLEDYDNAIINYRKASRDSGYSDDLREKAITRIVQIYKISGDLNKAIDEYTGAVRYFNDNSTKIRFFTAAAGIQLSANDDAKLPKAVALYQSALAVKGIFAEQRRDLFFLLADAYYAYGTASDAMACLSEAANHKDIMDDNSFLADIWERIADIQRREGMGKEEIESLESAVELLEVCQRSAELLIAIAQKHVDAQDYYSAKHAFLRAYNMEGISDVIQLTVRDKMADLVRNVYFSDLPYRYDFTISTFGDLPDCRMDSALLYAQANLKLNKSPDKPDGALARLASTDYTYHPKALIYCAALNIKSNNEDGAKALLPPLTKIYKEQPANFNNADIINYIKLLIRYGMYDDALVIMKGLDRFEDDEYLHAHKTVLELSAAFFARNLIGQHIPKKELTNMQDSLVSTLSYFSDTKASVSLNSINYLLVLIADQLGERIDYTELEKYLPAYNSTNMYLNAFIQYRIEHDFESALKTCERLLLADPDSYDGFSVYDILLLDAEISYEYAHLVDGDVRIKYLNRSVKDYETILHEISYYYKQSYEGLTKAREAMGISYPIDIQKT